MFADFLKKVTAGHTLDALESEQAISSLLEGSIADDAIAAFLSAMHKRGETEDEVLGAVRSLRGKMHVFAGAEGALDCCGTGGDNHGTLNISTATAFVLAGAGVKIAKHGNRAVSSKSGSSDILTALGIKADAPAAVMKRALDAANICFLLAPLYHPAMKNVAAARAKLGHRSIFNLVGPLANPACVKKQVVGVFRPEWLQRFAAILQKLGSTDALVVHGDDGLDEITTTTTTHGCRLQNSMVTKLDIAPEQVGLPRATLEQLKGTDAAGNAAKLRELLGGAKGPYRDIVLINAAAGLMVAGKAGDWQNGITLAAEAIDEGRAGAALEKFVQVTNG